MGARRRLVPLLIVAALSIVVLATAFLVMNTERPAESVALVRFDSLENGVPLIVEDDELAGVERLPRGGRRSGGMSVPRVVLVRDGDSVVAFVGADPTRGCVLDVIQQQMSSGGPQGPTFRTVLHDTCFGSLFDLTGSLSGGPGRYDLDRVETSIRDGIVYAHPRNVIAGRDRY